MAAESGATLMDVADVRTRQIGALVVYVNDLGEASWATIHALGYGNLVDLVFEGKPPVTSVRYDAEGAPFSWHWPNLTPGPVMVKEQ